MLSHDGSDCFRTISTSWSSGLNSSTGRLIPRAYRRRSHLRSHRAHRAAPKTTKIVTTAGTAADIGRELPPPFFPTLLLLLLIPPLPVLPSSPATPSPPLEAAAMMFLASRPMGLNFTMFESAVQVEHCCILLTLLPRLLTSKVVLALVGQVNVTMSYNGEVRRVGGDP